MNEQVMLENALREQARKDVVNQIAQEYIANGLAKSLAVRNTRPQFVTASDKSPLAKAAKDAYETALKDRTIKQEAIAFQQEMERDKFNESKRQFDKSLEVKEAALLAQLGGGSSGAGGDSNISVQDAQILKDANTDSTNLTSADKFLRGIRALVAGRGDAHYENGEFTSKGSTNLWRNSQEEFGHNIANYLYNNLDKANIETGTGKKSILDLINKLPKDKQSQLFKQWNDEIYKSMKELPETNWNILRNGLTAVHQYKGKDITSEEFFQNTLLPIAQGMLELDTKAKIIQATKGGNKNKATQLNY